MPDNPIHSSPVTEIRPDTGKIYILPTREGMLLIMIVVVMLLVAINYQNSLIFAFAFLLCGIFFTCMLYTHRNLSCLKVRPVKSRTAFASEDACFTLAVSSKGKSEIHDLTLGFNADLFVCGNYFREERLVDLYVPTSERGYFDPGKLLIETRWPLGLFRAWTRRGINMTSLVYPKPVICDLPETALVISDTGTAINREGADDFFGLREYQESDSLRHIDWKVYARSDQLMVKQFGSTIDTSLWLDWDHFGNASKEERLGKLCYCVIQLSQKEVVFGLNMPSVSVEPSKGDNHRISLLKHLALY